jgi:cation-transporting ATPase E
LPKVVQEGRRVVNNVQKVATLFLTKTIFSFLLSFVILFMNYIIGIPIKFPIASNQLIIIELLAIGIPAFFLALEPNNNLIKGNFLLNVLKKALPGGLVVTAAILTIYSFSTSLDLSDKVSTMSTIVAAYVCLMVLYRVCQPFTTARRMLFAAMFTIYLACLFVKPLSVGMFEFTPLDVPQLLLVILLIVLTNSVLDFLTKLPANISNIILEKLRFKRVRIILEDRERSQERKGILDRISDKLIGEDDLPTKKK